MDIFKRIQYALEKQAVSRNVPDVSSIPNRWKLHHDDSDEGEAIDHSLWDQLLQQHVHVNCTVGSTSMCHAVDYENMAKDERFEQYLEQLASSDLTKLSRREQLALWINAYNALCISLIVKAEAQRQANGEDKATLHSINKLSNEMDGPVWDQMAGIVGGLELSLNDIEHVQLRSQWDEPSIHACVVCASASCPNLRPEAFVGSRLREQMTSQMQDWLSHPTKGLCLKENRLWLSRIFLWFGNDFGNTMMNVSNFPFFGDVAGERSFRAWLAQFVVRDGATATRIEYEHDGLRYFGYDWQLNRWTK